MLNFKIDARVLVNERGATKPQYGRINSVCPTITGNNILLVKLDNGELIKCHTENVILVEESEKEKQPETITITKDDFMKAVFKVTDPTFFAKKGADFETTLLMSLSGLSTCNELRRELFGEKADND